MMKSFFKKLAFVMALAMVVSMVAPAGDAFAATTGIALQGTNTIVTEFTIEKVGATVDFCFKGAPADWKSTFEWTTSEEDVATVDKAGVVTAVAPGTATITITAGADKSYVETVKITVKEQVEELTAKQVTAKTVKVTFTENHGFDATGADADGVNTVKVYRVFSTEEMAKMANKNGLKFDEEGNGYQAYYVMDVDVEWTKDGKEDFTTWTIAGYDWFVDGAKYAVVYGPNETSSTIEGIMATFTAYVGKPASIELWATQATVENDVEPAIPADIYCTIYNKQKIDITDYCNASEVFTDTSEIDYELVTDDVDASVSGNEVTFDEVGSVKVLGTYIFYDEDLEEDVPLTDDVTVLGGKYSTYRVDKIYNWSLGNDFNYNWSKTTTSMIAGDSDQLFVIVEDNRGNLYSNVPGIEKLDVWLKNANNVKVKVMEIGDNSHIDAQKANPEENTAFEQYGYELVFDSLDPDSLLVDPLGAVETYKKTNSFAVVSYKRSDDEAAKLHEIGVMGITVKAPRVLDSVKYKNGTSFTVLKETEAEDNIPDYYGAHSDYKYDDFKLSAQLKVEFLNQYGKTWDSKAEDWGRDTEFTVTTSKDAFDGIAETIAAALNESQAYTIDAGMFAGTTATSVTFKIKESATGDSTNVTIKLDVPKYNEDNSVYVDPAKAIMDVAGKELYKSVVTDAKLFQVSKASQKVGYVRVGTLENDKPDEDRNYYLANKLIKSSFTVSDEKGKKLEDYVTTASDAALNGLKEGDYILVVTDQAGKLVPEAGKGASGLAVDAESNIGLVASEDGTHFDFILAAMSKTEDAKGNALKSELEYATEGTYRATVYKVTNETPVKDDKNVVVGTKYTISRVSSDSFKIDKSFKPVTFFHQEKTKDVDLNNTVFTETDKEMIYEAVAQTMTFRIAGQDLKFEEEDGKYVDCYKNYLRCDCHNWEDFHHTDLKVELIDADFKVQEGGARAVINTVTVRVYTLAKDMYYDVKVKVNRSVNVAD